jgi:hypothetical protein
MSADKGRRRKLDNRMEHPKFDTDTDPTLDEDDLFEPANDNHRPDPSLRRVPRYVTEGQTDLLLALAGVDPDKVPRRLHDSAVRVAWCEQHGLFSHRAIARACGLSRKKLARTFAALRAAQKGRAA